MLHRALFCFASLLFLGAGCSRQNDSPRGDTAAGRASDSAKADAKPKTKRSLKLAPRTLKEATQDNPLRPKAPEGGTARNGPDRSAAPPAKLDALTLPEGFSIAMYSDEVPSARSLARGPKGVVFVSTRKDSRVYALSDPDGDHANVSVHTVAKGLDTPNGIAYRDGDLYIAEIGRILVLRGIDGRLANPPEPEVLTEALPTDPHHGWRYIRFGPDGKLYVPIGAPCNVCKRSEPIYASIARLEPDGTGLEIFARGVRNSVGFDWHPRTKELWFTENGRDELGDDLPPDELNRAPKAGIHFGFPHCHAGVILDPKHGQEGDCAKYTPPVQQLGPHVAALGMRFYTGTMFPARYRGGVILAEHGSWNRTTKLGYRVMVVPLDDAGRPEGYEPLVGGFVTGDEVRGRPVDVEILDDGSLLISDDYQGAVYRLRYGG